MKEIKKVKTALQAVERWGEYLFRRALGVTFIVWAAVVAVAGFITLKAEAIAMALVMDQGALMGFTWLVAILIALSISAYSFALAGRTFEKMKPVQRRERVGMAGLGIVWFAAMSTASYLGRYIGHAAVWPLFIGIANVLTYAIIRAMGKGYPEQLLVGVMLLIAFPMVYMTGTGEIANLSGLAAIVLAYSVGGVYSLLAAPRALVEGKQPRGR